MVQGDNALKSGQELETMVDWKCRGEFRRFGAFSLDGVVLWLFHKCIFFNLYITIDFY